MVVKGGIPPKPAFAGFVYYGRRKRFPDSTAVIVGTAGRIYAQNPPEMRLSMRRICYIQNKKGGKSVINIVYHMDCEIALWEMPDNSFDLAVVDPPYGLNIRGDMGRRRGQTRKHKQVFWDAKPPPPEYFRELRRVSRHQIIWGANHFISMLPAADSHCWLCWDKKYSPEVSFASFELAWTNFDLPCKRIALSPFQLGRIHPTQKPIALYAWIFERFAKPGDKILDTHLGSGSSRIAAYDAGLDFTGYEIDGDYFEAQERRFAAYVREYPH